MAKNLEFDIVFFEGVLRHVPEFAEAIEILGGLYTKAGRIDDGLRMDRKLVKLKPENPTAHYNLGCSFALKARMTDAIRSLRRAVELGYDDITWMKSDPDLKALQDHPAFLELLDDIVSN